VFYSVYTPLAFHPFYSQAGTNLSDQWLNYEQSKKKKKKEHWTGLALISDKQRIFPCLPIFSYNGHRFLLDCVLSKLLARVLTYFVVLSILRTCIWNTKEIRVSLKITFVFQQSWQTMKLKKYSNTLTGENISEQLIKQRIWGKVQLSPFEIPVCKESCKTEWLLLRLDHFREKDYALIVESQLIIFSFSHTSRPSNQLSKWNIKLFRIPYLGYFD